MKMYSVKIISLDWVLIILTFILIWKTLDFIHFWVGVRGISLSLHLILKEVFLISVSSNTCSSFLDIFISHFFLWHLRVILGGSFLCQSSDSGAQSSTLLSNLFSLDIREEAAQNNYNNNKCNNGTWGGSSLLFGNLSISNCECGLILPSLSLTHNFICFKINFGYRKIIIICYSDCIFGGILVYLLCHYFNNCTIRLIR